jgi:3-oxoacyl-[acyl-carrier-protein] synthase-3
VKNFQEKFMQSVLKAIEYHLPDSILTNEQLALEYPEWTAEKIEDKLGIVERHIADGNECASDLAVKAAQKLFASGICEPHNIDYILLCTQSPDYLLPTTACLIQDRLGIPKTAGALDFNLGCSGFVYGLGLAKGLIETGQAQNVLLIMAETYSKFIHPLDKSVRTLFGDAAAAVFVQGTEEDEEESTSWIGPFVFGTDGGGANHLIVPVSGLRHPHSKSPGQLLTDEQGNQRSDENLYMNGSEIFAFSLQVVPQVVRELLAKSGKTLDEIDLFVFHQANMYMLEYLRKKAKIPKDKFYLAMRHYGNTVSCTIPIALKDALDNGKLHSGDLVMLVGFGVGLSWGATLIRWQG